MKRITRQSYGAIMKDFCAVVNTRSHVIKALGRTMRRELRSASGKDSPFHKDIQAIKSFNWDSYMEAVERNAPCLVQLFKVVLRRGSSPILAVIASMIMKNCNSHVCLMQAVISVVLFGNGCKKAVCMICRQPHHVMPPIDFLIIIILYLGLQTPPTNVTLSIT